MSSFGYGEHSDKRIGVWIRYRSNPDIISFIKRSGNKRLLDSVTRIVVVDYDAESDQVWLEVYCKNMMDVLRNKHRYNVFYLNVKVNPDWICEGDLGRGLVL